MCVNADIVGAESVADPSGASSENARVGQPLASLGDVFKTTIKNLESARRFYGIESTRNGEVRARLALHFLQLEAKSGVDRVVPQLSEALARAWDRPTSLKEWAAQNLGEECGEAWFGTETLVRIIERLFSDQGTSIWLTGEVLRVASLSQSRYPSFMVRDCFDRILSREKQEADKGLCKSHGLLWTRYDYILPGLLSYGLFPGDKLFDLYRSRLRALLGRSWRSGRHLRELLKEFGMGTRDVDGHSLLLEPWGLEVCGSRVPCQLDVLTSFWLGVRNCLAFTCAMMLTSLQQGLALARFEGRRRRRTGGEAADHIPHEATIEGVDKQPPGPQPGAAQEASVIACLDTSIPDHHS